MADLKIWGQGNSTTWGPNCDGTPPESCPSSQRIATEYKHGYYTLTSVINPVIDAYDCGNPGWMSRKLAEVEAGDTIYMLAIPPHTLTLALSALVGQTLERGSSMASMIGLRYTVIADEFETEGVTNPGGDAEPVYGPLDVCEPGMRLFASPSLEVTEDTVDRRNKGTDSNLMMFEATQFPPKNNRWVGIGVRIDALPGDMSLSELTGYIALAAHVLAIDHQLSV